MLGLALTLTLTLTLTSLFEYVDQRGNEETIVAAQIETKDALENVDEICAIDGLDMAFVGPGDLCTDMGLTAKHGLQKAFGTPEYQDACKVVVESPNPNPKSLTRTRTRTRTLTLTLTLTLNLTRSS